jgi:hypothetical protein
MNPNPAPSNVAPAAPQKKSQSLRVHAVVLLVLVIIESAVGGSLALEGSTYSLGYLGGHIGLAVLLVLLSAWVLVLARRVAAPLAQIAAGITLLACIGATIAGTVFLTAGQSNGALDAMEGFAGVAVLTSLILIVVGSVRDSPQASPQRSDLA